MSSIALHNAIEGVMERSTQAINYNRALWLQGMKLNLLSSQQFLQWYERPRYWVIYKQSKAGQKQYDRVRVRVSNTQFAQYSEQTKKFLPCELEYHHAVKIQTLEEFQKLNSDYRALLWEMNQLQAQIHDQATKGRLDKRLKEIQVQYCGQCQDWKEPASTQRIIILAKGEEFKDLTYFIYQQEEQFRQFRPEQWPKRPLTLKTNKQALLFMKQIIKIHHSRRKNEKLLTKIKNNFRQSVDKSLFDTYKQHKLQEQNKKARQNSNKQLAQAFQKYELTQSRLFVERLKQATKRSKTYLFVQVFSIWLNKSNVPVSVRLIVDGQQAIKYEYRYFENEYLVYFPSEESDRKYFKINIDNSRVFRKYSFQVEIRFKNSDLVKYTNDHLVYVLQKRENLFVQELILQNTLLFDQPNDASCIIYFNQIFSRTQKIRSLVEYYQSSIFKKVGEIPSKYSTTYKIDYSPSNYKIIRALLNNDSYGTKLNKANYQKTYYELVRFSQKQENQSQRIILLTPPLKRTNAFPMKERYEVYSKKVLQSIGYFSKTQTLDYYFQTNYQKLANNITENERNIIVSKVQYKNLMEDLKLYKVRNLSLLKKEMVKFIYFSNQVQKIQSFPFTLRYSSQLIPIFDCLLQVYLNSKQNDLGRSSMRGFQSTNYIFSFIAFIAKMYPYSDLANLKSDLYILRWLVQKKLSYFNDYLNRNNIGLENLISDHLLHLFTALPSELTYRIWDYLFSSQKKESRIIIAFTLLTFLQTTNTLTIIPINQFMQRVQLNAKTIFVDKQFAIKFAKISETYFSIEQAKHNRLTKHLKGSKEVSLIQDRILKKMILGESKLKIPYEQQGKIPVPKSNDKSNTLTIKQLSYPLPQPNYRGYSIIEIVIFLHDLQILQNINLNSNKYWIKFSVPDTQWKQYIQIVQKNYFYNKPIRIANEYINFYRPQQKNKRIGERHIKVSIVSNANVNGRDESKERTELKGFIDYGLYEKDKAFKISTILSPESHHNKGMTTLNLSICLKSHMLNQPLPAKINFEPLQTLSQKLLDYDIGQSNQCIVACSKLAASLQKIKYPLDEFNSDQYKRIRSMALNEHESQWLRSSSTSIEELKSIFYNLFHQEKDKSIKHQFSKIYQIFAQEHNMQFVYFAQILVKLILLAKISRKKKLMYLFCVAVHYQNCYSKKINIETINSLIRLIHKQHSFINPCPYVQGSYGTIIEAHYFQSDLKSELKKDFTEIVQDWAYICNFKYGYGDIILGSSKDLSILRSFFDLKTIKKMQQQKECRFEIIYQVEGCRYLWSAVVDTKTFEIVKRGTKFLNQFTGYSPIHYLSSTQEYLLNCENVLPLSLHKGLTYQQFTQVMLSNNLIRYLLDLQVYGHTNKKEDFIYGFDNHQEEDDDKVESIVQKTQFNSWALIRGQNCLQSWRKCVVTHPGKVMSKIKYESDESEYNVATLDVINMEEVDLRQQQLK